MDWNYVSYCSCTFGSRLICNVFFFYYVYYFIEVYKISNAAFQVSQVIFLLWNAINDPLFGMFQDHSSAKWLQSRQMNIYYGAPLFALSFMTPWVPVCDILGTDSQLVKGLHLTFSLCFWDAMFSFVLLAHCSLYTEITSSEAQRVQLTLYGQVAAMLACWTVPLVEACTQFGGSRGLYVSTLSIALLSAFFIGCTGNRTQSLVDRSAAAKCHTLNKAPTIKDLFSRAYLKLNSELFFTKDFQAFVWMNFINTGIVMVASNFTKLFTEDLHLFSSSKMGKILFFTLMMLGSRMLVLVSYPAVNKWGAFNIVRASFVFLIMSSVVLSLFQHSAMVSLQILLINTVPDATSSFGTLFISNIIAADTVRNERELPLSSMFFGLNALVIKPSQSLFPMLVAYWLQVSGGDLNDSSKRSTESIVRFLWLVPLVLCTLQLAIFSLYTLRRPDTHALQAKTFSGEMGSFERNYGSVLENQKVDIKPSPSASTI